MALSSIKTLRELYTVPPIWWPEAPTLRQLPQGALRVEHPALLPQQRHHLASARPALALVLAIFASYGFARFDFRGKPLLQAFVLIGQLLPTAAIIVPLFITLRVLGLVNTYWGLILVYMIITLPLSVWMLTSYFRAIPVELEEAAIIDGASRLGVLFRITLPLSLPGHRRGRGLCLRHHLERVHLRALLRHRLLGEDAADRPRRVLDRVQHRLGRGDGRLGGHDAADRAPLPRPCSGSSSAA